MTGIFFLTVMAIWGYCAFRLARWCTKKITRSTMRHVATGGFFVLLMLLPVSDEIIGGIQFRGLCKANSFIDVDTKKIRDRVVVLDGETNIGIPGILDEPVFSTIPILQSTSTWKYQETGQVAFTYRQYLAKGGWLVRSLKLTESNVPIVFSKHSCQPVNKKEIFSIVKTK